MGRQISKLQITLRLLAVVVFISVTNTLAYANIPKWFSKIKQIKPMATSKQEVERLFDNPKIINTYIGETGQSVEYMIKEGRLEVAYSLGNCSGESKYGYNVAKDTVTRITLTLKKQSKISNLGLNLSKFHKNGIGDVEGLFTYTSENSSERFTGSNTQIQDFSIYPSEQQEENLACSNVKKNL